MYIQLKEKIRDDLNNNTWKVGNKIPSENSLMEKFNVSRTTVRSALRELVNEGILYSKQGKGTFVAEPKMQHSLARITTSFTNDIKSKGRKPGSIQKELTLKSPPIKIRKFFNLSKNKDAIYLERIRTVNKKKVGVHVVYLNPKIIDWNIFSQINLENKSLYNVLENEFSLKIIGAKETIEAVSVDTKISQYLEIQKETPLLKLTRRSFVQNEKPLEFVEMVYRGDKYKYYISSMEENQN